MKTFHTLLEIVAVSESAQHCCNFRFIGLCVKGKHFLCVCVCQLLFFTPIFIQTAVHASSHCGWSEAQQMPGALINTAVKKGNACQSFQCTMDSCQAGGLLGLSISHTHTQNVFLYIEDSFQLFISVGGSHSIQQIVTSTLCVYFLFHFIDYFQPLFYISIAQGARHYVTKTALDFFLWNYFQFSPLCIKVATMNNYHFYFIKVLYKCHEL